MKEKNPYYLIIGTLIFCCYVLTLALQKPDGSRMEVKPVSTISQDCSISGDFGLSDANAENPEVQISVLRQEIRVASKTINCSKYINVSFYNKNIKNQISTPVLREFIHNQQCSILFSGVLLI